MTAKADRVRALLESEDLKEAFENLERYLFDAFCETSADDIEMLRSIRMRLTAVTMLKNELIAAVDAGDYEDFMAAQKEREKLNMH